MKLNIKDFSAKSIEVGTNGVEFEVKDTKDKSLGSLVITKGSLIWCKGKTKKEDGKKITWKKFMDMMEAD